jgi:hypothetical protein
MARILGNFDICFARSWLTSYVVLLIRPAAREAAYGV